MLLLAGCKPNYNKLTGDMKSLENRLYGPSAMMFDSVKADSLMNMYGKFLERFPKDTLAPSVIFKMANLAVSLGKADSAISLFDRYMNEYPQGPKAEVCLFFKAFVYENNIKNYDKAKEIYRLFIEKYPNSDFADDAKIAIDNMGKSPDQFFMEFEARRKADSTRVADSIAGLASKKGRKR